MPRRKNKMLCGACGSTGSVLVGDVDEVCKECSGIGYLEVEYEDARTLDRIRERQHLGSLRRFTVVVAVVAGAGLTFLAYPWLEPLGVIWEALGFIGLGLVSYFFLRLAWPAAVLYKLLIFFKLLVGLVLFIGLVAGVAYFMYITRELGGW